MANPISFSTILVTWFGVGFAPAASGTAGSLAALPFAWAIQSAFGPLGLLAASSLCFFIGWWASRVYLTAHPDRGIDPKEIVIDEVAGQWFLLSLMPQTVLAYAVGFALFRFFDVMKPCPVSVADRKVKGAFGVMLDDMLAAAYPVFILALLGLVLPYFGYAVDLDAIHAWLSQDVFH